MRTIGQASVLSQLDWKKLESVANQKHRLLWAILRFTAARINEALEQKRNQKRERQKSYCASLHRIKAKA
jgi:hypothetical protein